MSLKKSDIVNQLNRRHGFRQFLEISVVSTGREFNKIDAAHLVKKERLVYGWPEQYTDGQPVTYKTSDRYSSRLVQQLLAAGERYDSIFVDPFHTYACSHTDLSGAFALLEPGGVMVVHDCGPNDPNLLSPKFREGPWCGVTYAAFIDFTLGRSGLSYYTVDCDHGCGVIYKHWGLLVQTIPSEWDHLLFDWDTVRHDDGKRLEFYLANRDRLLNLISEDQFSRL